MTFLQRVKSVVRPFVPPVIAERLRRGRGAAPSGRDAPGGVRFEGDYKTWQEARRQARGYDDRAILEKAIAAALKVKRGDVPYERDTVVFDHIQHSFPVAAGLLYAATRHGRLSVLDFGGALGSSYWENKPFVGHLPGLRWSIVEQPHFVEAGQKGFQTDVLRFYRGVDECLSSEQPNVVLLSSVLQYLPDPFSFLSDLEARKIPVIIVDRTPAIDGKKTRLTVQTVPPAIYDASYPAWIFGFDELEQHLPRSYDVRARFGAHVGTTIELGDKTGRYVGWLLEERHGWGQGAGIHAP